MKHWSLNEFMRKDILSGTESFQCVNTKRLKQSILDIRGEGESITVNA